MVANDQFHNFHGSNIKRQKKNYNYEETAVQHSYIRTIPVLKLNYIWAEKLKRVAVATMYQGQAAV